MLSWPLGSWTLRLLIAWFTWSHRNLFNCCSPIFICQKENMMYACNTDRYRFAHCGTDMFGEVTTFACCFQHRWHPKKETILSWSLVTGKRQWVKDTSRCCDPPWHANRLDTQRFARADSQTCFFLCIFFWGGFAPLVLPSDIVTSRNKGALPPCFFLPGFLCFAYIMLCIYIYTYGCIYLYGICLLSSASKLQDVRKSASGRWVQGRFPASEFRENQNALTYKTPSDVVSPRAV